VLQCVAVRCSVLRCVAVCQISRPSTSNRLEHLGQMSHLFRLSICCSVLQCVAVCYSVLQCVAVCCSKMQFVLVCCIVLQGVAVYCSVLCICVAQRIHKFDVT